MKYKYAWLHIPTGKTGKVEREFLSRLLFLESLNNWNRIGNSWKYWEEA